MPLGFLDLPWFVRSRIYQLLFAGIAVRPNIHHEPSSFLGRFSICITCKLIKAEAHEAFFREVVISLRSPEELHWVRQNLSKTEAALVTSVQVPVRRSPLSFALPRNRPGNGPRNNPNAVPQGTDDFVCTRLYVRSIATTFPHVREVNVKLDSATDLFYCQSSFKDLVKCARETSPGYLSLRNPWNINTTVAGLTWHCFASLGESVQSWLLHIVADAGDRRINIKCHIKFVCSADPRLQGREYLSGCMSANDWTLLVDDDEGVEAIPQTPFYKFIGIRLSLAATMRLLHTTTLKFSEFFEANIPQYAILSHRWDKHEPTYQLFRDTIDKTDPLFAKTLAACQYMKALRLDWIWIDTVCIDKTSSAELTEAINSMFQWYQNATCCYAYLSDVDRKAPSPVPGLAADVLEHFKNSKWFTRGWTIQELVAPKKVLFLDAHWSVIGDASHLRDAVREVTSIDIANWQGACVAHRMSWAAKRQTTRPEDLAYCLLGLFDVNMPLLYGEGQLKAFTRLQLEIIKKSDDESIFAWCSPHPVQSPSTPTAAAAAAAAAGGGGTVHSSPAMSQGVGMLAPHPSYFAESAPLQLRPEIDMLRLPYTMTNKGLQFHLPVTAGNQRWWPHNPGELQELALNVWKPDPNRGHSHGQGQLQSVILVLRNRGNNVWERIRADEWLLDVPVHGILGPNKEPHTRVIFVRQPGL